MGEVSTTAKKPTRLKWVRRIAVVLVIYTVMGFFVAPAIIKSQMLKRLPALTKRQVTVTQVKCNPYVLSLTIRGFALKEANGDVFSSFDEFYVNFQPWASLFKWSWVFDEISLKKPFAQIIYQPDGSFNFMNLLTNAAPAAKPPSSSAPLTLPAVIIYKLQITNGAVAFADLNRKTPFRAQFAPIDVHLTNLTTIRDRKGPYSFLARTDSGEIFAWSGTITLNPLRSDGTFRLGGLQLPEFATYVHDYARFDITRGKLDVYADYRYDSVTNALDLSVSNAAVYLTDLEIKTPDTGETAISIPSLAVTGTEASVARRTARVGLVKSSNGSILARQNHDGTINLLAQLNLPAKPATGGQQSAPAEATTFSAKIDEIAFDNYSIKAEDQKPAKPAAFNIDKLGFDLKGVSNLSNAPVAVDMSLRFQDTGSIAVNGTATLLPPSADLGIMVTNIDLRAIQPYVEEQIKLAITGGGVNAQGRARYASPEPGAPLISFAGNASVNKFATSDDVLFKDFTKWDALEIGGINLQMQPDKLSVDEVKFTGLSASLVVGPDHRANLQTILRNQIAAKTNVAATVATTAEAPAAPSAATNKIPDLALGTLAFENASIHFSDQSIEPHCTFDVQEFGGTIKGLSSQPDTTAAVDVNGKVDARSPFNVSGKVHPLGDLFADIAVAFTNTELTAFTPYTEKFAGRPLQKGKLSFGVHYLVNHNDLKAENGFYVDQLTLGPKNNSPDATSLPVKLAIALLKDRNGRIKLDVPVTGRIDDPKFRLGPIIWQVVMNLIAKAATSPFSLLGAMFGGGEELSFVEFAPGQSAIPDAQTNKLETLIKALYERPELTMEINGSVDPALDREPLARNKLDQQIKSLWIKKLTDAGKSAVALEEVHLEPADYERLLKKVYRTTLGDYKPTEAATNQALGLASGPGAAAGVSPAAAPDHGATLLLAPVRLVKPPPMKIPVVTPGGNPAAMPTPTTPEIADMEAQLAQKIEVTDDDLRDLMNQRAARVQAYLLKDGKLDAGRLFITAPKPASAASKGEDRVNLTLD